MERKPIDADNLASARRRSDPSEAALAETTSMPLAAATTDNSSDPFKTIAPRREAPDVARRMIGRYTVLGKLGSGGQADVFRAVHPTLPIEVAIKLSHRQFDSAARESLTAEAHILCDLDHPNIAKVRDFDFMDGQPFMVLDFIRGQSLAQLAQALRPTQTDAAKLVAKLARAIAFANSQGVIHRDLKPENVVIDGKGEPKIIDFGMSRLRSAMDSEMPEANEVSGTLVYMSPEQAHGISSKTDHRVDVFALGAILYRLLVGKQPYPQMPLRELHGLVCQGNWDTASLDAADASEKLKAICRRAMHRDPAERFATAEAMSDALQQCTTQTASDVSAELNPGHSNKRTVSVAGSSLGCAVSLTMAFSALFMVSWTTFTNSKAPESAGAMGNLTAPGEDSASPSMRPIEDLLPVSEAPSADQSLIQTFEIIHIGNSAERAEFSGSLLQFRAPRENDDIQVKAEFNLPVYCFLVALNPDGVKQLCYPVDDDKPQTDPVTTLRYPFDETAAFGLTDGVGQQAFVLFTSCEPLPAFNTWKSELTVASWPNPDVVGNWTYASGELTALANPSGPASQEIRGTVRTTKTPTPFKELCDRLRQSETSDVRGVIFEVQPQ